MLGSFFSKRSFLIFMIVCFSFSAQNQLEAQSLSSLGYDCEFDYSDDYTSDWSTLDTGKEMLDGVFSTDPFKYSVTYTGTASGPLLTDSNKTSITIDNTWLYNQLSSNSNFTISTDASAQEGFEFDWASGVYVRFIQLENIDYITIEDLAIRNSPTVSSTSDPYARTKYTIQINGCETLIVRDSYFGGPVGDNHLEVHGCKEVLIENSEVAGTPQEFYSESDGTTVVFEGNVAGGGFSVNNSGVKEGTGATYNGYDCLELDNSGPFSTFVNAETSESWWRDLECLIIQNNYVHDYNTRAACIYHDRNFSIWGTQNHDGIEINSAANGVMFNNVIENWASTGCSDQALDISHGRICDGYEDNAFRIERNMFLNEDAGQEAAIKLRGYADGSNTMLFTNNIFLNHEIYDTHMLYDIHFVNNTHYFEDQPTSMPQYPTVGSYNLNTHLGWSSDDFVLEYDNPGGIRNFFSATYPSPGGGALLSGGYISGSWSWNFDADLPIFGSAFFTDLYGVSTSEVYAVGKDNLILKYDGSSWSDVSPSGGGSDHLFTVTGALGTEWASGENGVIFENTGSGWTAHSSSPTTNDIRGSWGTSSYFYIVAGNNKVYRYNGSTWYNVALTFPLNFPKLRDIQGEDNGGTITLYVVGDNGKIFNKVGTGLWKTEAIASLGSSTSFSQTHNPNLYAVAGNDQDGVYAVGECGTVIKRTSNTAGGIRLWDDHTETVWSSAILSQIYPSSSPYEKDGDDCYYHLSDVYVTSDYAYFVGYNGVVIQYDGTTSTLLMPDDATLSHGSIPSSFTTMPHAWYGGLWVKKMGNNVHIFAGTKGYNDGRAVFVNSEVYDEDDGPTSALSLYLMNGNDVTYSDPVAYHGAEWLDRLGLAYNTYISDHTNGTVSALLSEDIPGSTYCSGSSCSHYLKSSDWSWFQSFNYDLYSNYDTPGSAGTCIDTAYDKYDPEYYVPSSSCITVSNGTDIFSSGIFNDNLNVTLDFLGNTRPDGTSDYPTNGALEP